MTEPIMPMTTSKFLERILLLFMVIDMYQILFKEYLIMATKNTLSHIPLIG
jgi:hypothetical protein